MTGEGEHSVSESVLADQRDQNEPQTVASGRKLNGNR